MGKVGLLCGRGVRRLVLIHTLYPCGKGVLYPFCVDQPSDCGSGQQRDQQDDGGPFCRILIPERIFHIAANVGGQLGLLRQRRADAQIDGGKTVHRPAGSLKQRPQSALAKFESGHKHRGAGKDQKQGKYQQGQLPPTQGKQPLNDGGQRRAKGAHGQTNSSKYSGAFADVEG